MNKKILFLILAAAVLLPSSLVLAAKSPTEILGSIKDLALNIAASVVIIGWVISGILYLISMGDPGKYGIAKTALIYSVIGTFLIAVAKVGPTIIKSIFGIK